MMLGTRSKLALVDNSNAIHGPLQPYICLSIRYLIISADILLKEYGYGIDFNVCNQEFYNILCGIRCSSVQSESWVYATHQKVGHLKYQPSETVDFNLSRVQPFVKANTLWQPISKKLKLLPQTNPNYPATNGGSNPYPKRLLPKES